jgi:hypothetical protein
LSCWTRKLHHLADKCNSPLVISGIPGRSDFTFVEEGRNYHYGGGGGGLFCAGQVHSHQFKEPDIICIDTSEGTATHEPFANAAA